MGIIYRAATPKPKYGVLSYFWGLPDRTYQVVITQTYPSSLHTTYFGKRISAKFGDFRTKATPMLALGKNLLVALEHLRYRDDARVLWIDAICINQDDSAEKSTEVLRMDNIYLDAQRVIVWLGVETENSSLAMSKLREIRQGINYWISGLTHEFMANPGSKLHHPCR